MGLLRFNGARNAECSLLAASRGVGHARCLSVVLSLPRATCARVYPRRGSTPFPPLHTRRYHSVALLCQKCRQQSIPARARTLSHGARLNLTAPNVMADFLLHFVANNETHKPPR